MWGPINNKAGPSVTGQLLPLSSVRAVSVTFLQCFKCTNILASFSCEGSIAVTMAVMAGLAQYFRDKGKLTICVFFHSLKCFRTNLQFDVKLFFQTVNMFDMFFQFRFMSATSERAKRNWNMVFV